MTSVISIFNTHFIEFLDDVLSIFPTNVNILAAKNSVVALKKINPSILIKAWKTYMTNVYFEQINNDDLSFFITKDYSKDLIYSANPDKIMDAINELRDPVSRMNEGDQQKTMKYIKNLTKLTLIYNP